MPELFNTNEKRLVRSLSRALPNFAATAEKKVLSVLKVYFKVAKQIETEWTRDICKEMENCGAIIRVLPGFATSSGLPDRLIVSTQFCGLLEFKGDNTPLRTNQAITLQNIWKRSQTFAFIIRKPNFIQRIIPEDYRCIATVANFDGTGKDLLAKLADLTKL